MARHDVPQLGGGDFTPADFREWNPAEGGYERSGPAHSSYYTGAADPSLDLAGYEDGPYDEEPQARAGWRSFLAEHWLICLVLLAATGLRVVLMLAYPPAFWFPDSLPYVQASIHLAPYNIRPVGYSFFLELLRPAHSIWLVTAAQHFMGVVVGAQVYALLRRHRLPAWGATFAAIPPLASVYALQIEHYVLSDALFGLLVTSAACLVLWRPRPAIWVCLAAGLLLAWAALDRSQGMLLIGPFLLYLAFARLGIGRFLVSAFAMSVTFLVPVLAYSAWFGATYGQFEMTTSTGAFVYSRVAAFADCSIIKPPADERYLCISTPVSQRPGEWWYVWDPQTPLGHGPAPGFSSLGNHLATNFAIRAISAQPLSYVRVVWHSTLQTFKPGGPANQSYTEYAFPASRPLALDALALKNDEDPSYGFKYNGNHDPSTRVVEPYAGWMQAYERNVSLSGPVLGVIVLAGLIGAVLALRRGGPMWLAWLTGTILVVTPAATADFDARYVVASVPVYCIAAALAVREIDYRARGMRLRGR